MSLLERFSLKDDPEANEMTKRIFGITIAEAFEKNICLGCKNSVVLDTEEERISYQIDGLCPVCSAKASAPSDNKNLASIQKATEKMREIIIDTVKFLDQNDGVQPIEVSLKKLSICKCGFTFLKEEIKLGTPYKIWVDKLFDLSYICGGCGKISKEVPHVLASQHLNKNMRPAALPLELFDYAGN